LDGIGEIYIRILSQIGNPIDRPLVASAQIIPEGGKKNWRAISREVETILDTSLENVTCVTEKVISGELKTF
jgi:S-adenosylmethionine synthetase